MSSWLLMGRTATKQNLHDSYYVKLFKYTTSVATVHSDLKLFSDLNLRRGDANRKEKKHGFLITQVTFLIEDKGLSIYNAMASGDDGIFKAEIYKNDTLFFVGNLILLTTKRDITESNPIIKLKVYDGLNRLKQFTDLTQFPSVKSKISEFVRVIFNALNFGIDIKVFQNIAFNNGIAGVAIRLEDYLVIKSNPNYYDILEIIMQQFQWEVFQENGYWKCRHLPSMQYVASSPADDIKETTINNSTGAVTYNSSLNLNHSLSYSDLANKATSFKCKLYSKVVSESPCYEPSILPKLYNRSGAVAWLNGEFQDGATGWTVGAGSPQFLAGAVKLQPGEHIYQESSSLSANQEVNIKFSGVQSRLVLADDEKLTAADNLLVIVRYITELKVYHLLNDASGWSDTQTDSNTFSFAINGRLVSGEYTEEYSTATLREDISVNVPNEDGVLVVFLYGGGPASGNNYSKEFVLYNNCQIAEVETNDHSVEVPAKYLVTASATTDNERNKEIDVPFADLDPFNTNYWFFTDDGYDPISYEKTKKWSTVFGNLPLPHYLAKAMLLLQLENNHGLNIELLPGNNLGFNNIVYGNLDGEGTRYYLPVYEEARLINDKRKFVLLEHKMSTSTVELTDEYVM